MALVKLHCAGIGDAFNTDGMASPAFIIETGDGYLLIDAGPTTLYRLRAMGLPLEKITHICITHFHGDHTAGLPFLMLGFQKKTSPRHVPQIIGPAGIHDFCKTLFEACYPGSGLDEGITYLEIPPRLRSGIEIGNNVTIDIFPMNHNPESIGYRFHVHHSVISISGDTGYHENLLSLIDGADIAVIECSSVYPEADAHTSLQEIRAHIDKMNARMIIPVHTTGQVLKELRMKPEHSIHIPFDGETITLKRE
ncbi:MAG: ribonuclease Z [Spirochaetales bacterium]|nr:ribonuclease Z [Spirochaetales bacterium]